MANLNLSFINRAFASTLLAIAAFIAVAGTQAQSTFNRHYTVEDGLSSNTVYCVKQDSKGYLWFGTDQGVCRYNGHSFTRYSILDGLSDNDILQIHEDSQGRLWFLTYSGTPCYYFNGTFHNSENTEFLKQAKMNRYLSSFTEGPDGSVYLSSSIGDLMRITRDNEVKIVARPNRDDPAAINQLWWYRQQLFGSSGGEFITNFTKKTRTDIQITLNQQGERGRFHFEDELLYCAQGNQLCIQSTEWDQPSTKTQLPDSGNIHYLGPGYYSDQIAVGTDRGLRFLHKGSLNLSELVLPGRFVTYLTKDHEDGLWVTTLNNGVYFAQSQNMINYTTTAIPHAPVYSLLYQSDTLWFGTSDRHFGYIVNDAVAAYHSLEKFGGLSAHGRILDFFQIDSVILFRAEKFLFRLNKASPETTSGSKLGSTTSLCVDSANNPWSASLGGIHPHFTRPKNSMGYQLKDGIFYLTWVKDSTFLCGTTNGVFRVVLDEERHEAIFPETRQKRVTGIRLMDNGRVVVATAGWGIYVYERDRLLGHFMTSGGYYPSYIHRIRVDPTGNLWLATNTGVYRIRNLQAEPDQWEWKRLDRSNGLLSDHVKDIAFSKDRIAVANFAGISIIDTVQLSQVRASPRLMIEKLSLPDSNHWISDTGAVVKIASGAMTLHLDAISFSTKNILYRYKVDDQPWVETPFRQLTFAELEQGAHTVEVAVKSDFSDWSKPRRVSFEVIGKWWQETSFYWLVALLVFGIFYAIFRLKIVLFDNELLLHYVRVWTDKALRRKVLTLKTSNAIVKVPIANILWVKSESNYCSVVTSDKKIMTLATLKSFEEQLEKEHHFMRVHRSYLINLRHVTAAKSSEVTIADHLITVGATYRNSFKSFYHSFKA